MLYLLLKGNLVHANTKPSLESVSSSVLILFMSNMASADHQSIVTNVIARMPVNEPIRPFVLERRFPAFILTQLPSPWHFIVDTASPG
jgi:hypothetical protein